MLSLSLARNCMQMSLHRLRNIVNKWHILRVNFSAPEPIFGDKFVHFLGTPRTVGIWRRFGTGPTLTINPMQDWRENLNEEILS